MNITPLKRDENGLLTHIKYPIKEDNTIDWIKLAPAGTVYIKPLFGKQLEKFTEKYGKPPEQCDPINDGIEDRYLVIALSGLRYLARIRGFNYVKFHVYESTPDYASAKCIIEWIPNYLTEGRTEIREDCASITPATANGLTKNYLTETVANRAEARAIRMSLGLNIVSKEELNPNDKEEQQFEEQSEINPASPKNVAREKIKKMGFTSFKEVANKLKEIGITDFDYERLDLVPTDKIMSLMGHLSKIGK